MIHLFVPSNNNEGLSILTALSFPLKRLIALQNVEFRPEICSDGEDDT